MDGFGSGNFRWCKHITVHVYVSHLTDSITSLADCREPTNDEITVNMQILYRAMADFYHQYNSLVLSSFALQYAIEVSVCLHLGAIHITGSVRLNVLQPTRHRHWTCRFGFRRCTLLPWGFLL